MCAQTRSNSNKGSDSKACRDGDKNSSKVTQGTGLRDKKIFFISGLLETKVQKVALSILLMILWVQLACSGQPRAGDVNFVKVFIYQLPVIRQALDLTQATAEWLDGFYITNVKYPHIPYVLQNLGNLALSARSAWQMGTLFR